MTTATAPSVATYARRIRPLLELATKSGRHLPGSPEREASDKFTALVQEFSTAGGSLSALSRELEMHEQTLYRRNRVGKTSSIAPGTRQAAGTNAREPKRVTRWATKINGAKTADERKSFVKDAYDEGVSMGALSKELGVSYQSLWLATRS